MPNKFDAKSFNPQAFKYKADRVPRTRMNEMRKSRVLAGNPDIRAVFTTQDGTAYARLAMRGLLDGDAVNYDGKTDITATSTKTFEQGVVVVGRAKAWTERDFSYDITGGQDFMDNVAKQVAEYWQDIDQDTLLAILRGVFAMTSAKGAEFVKKHTFTVDGPMEATTLNSATAQACGDHKKKFSMIFMHSVVSTNLENLNLLTALKYTDKDGVTRDLTLYTWNGKLVVVDDGMPTEQGEDGGTVYTSYVLGEGTINYEDIGAKVPYEMARDP
ncbi:MAG: phage coat protein, partial [Oscillospiraceae bacterium]